MSQNLLIFDLDGTLIDSVPDLAAATNAMLTELNHSTYSEADIRNWVGNGSYKLVQRALSGSAKVDATLSDDDTQHAQEIFFQKYSEATCVRTKPYQGVNEGLASLQQAGYRLALVTNKPIRFVPAIMTTFGWTDLFSITLGGDSLAVKKPDPTPLLHACERLNIDSAQAIMIGDSKNDILAGQNAGMMTLGLSYGYNYGQDIRDHHPDHAFDTFADLTAFLLDRLPD